ncbi:MAG: hypothetical protein Q9196_000999 [Gyalolechia fulgens]
MARPTTHLNLSSIYRWHEIENEKSLVYSLSPEAIQNDFQWIPVHVPEYHLTRNTLNNASKEHYPYTPMSTLENLTRLAAKPGVQSTLVLSKSDGSIIRSTGLLASLAHETPSEASITGDGVGEGGNIPSATILNNGAHFHGHRANEDGSKTAENIARLVFAFLSAANQFAEGMEKDDDTKLLRMRTRKNEIVIVPDPKFVLVVIHDAPQG